MTQDLIPSGLTELLDSTLPETELLARTVRLAEEHAAAGHPPFTAVVVRDGRVIGVGANRILIDSDPAAHGEVEAIRDAGRRAGLESLTGSVVLSSCEPCAICRTVAAAAGVTEIVYAAGRELVPAEIDSNPERTGALMDAVAELVPGIARAGESGLSAEELATPFAVYLRTLG
ncbi:nucleoside deaminase [Microlunatus parietis]|uniref:tRNA(Arg) A34 adenosine deaminase TadA n=1 Tax=Microlunatus parietis TaxID=682979 RepID=A0A7Y9I6W4_9ACTN|nr:deaminase [Microlunatus parietis]NYE71228.1 tRNA(Arg) A34 adenosine deaminase TadA [Microlunatus parietis]